MTMQTQTTVLANPLPTYVGDEARKAELQQMPRLIDWLYRTAAARGQTKAEMSQQIGVTFGYVRQLATGVRLVEQVSGDFCRACANYLDIPPVAVMLAAGRITLQDFLMPEVERAPGWQLTAGLERIAADPLVGCLMPQEVWDAPDPVKQLLVDPVRRRNQAGADADPPATGDIPGGCRTQHSCSRKRILRTMPSISRTTAGAKNERSRRGGV